MNNACTSQLGADKIALQSARAAAEAIHNRAATRKDDITGGGVFDFRPYAPHMDDLVTIFNNIAFSPAYLAWQDQCRAALVEKITSEEDFVTLLTSSWKKHNSEELIAHATKLSHAQQDIYSLPHVPLGLRVKFLHAGARHDGHHSPPAPGTTTHILAFRVGRDSGFTNVAHALNVVFHENTHLTQSALGFAQRNRIIREDHPLHRDAALFQRLFEDNVIYIPRSPAYKAHPLERDAFTQAELFVDEIKAALKTRGLALGS